MCRPSSPEVPGARAQVVVGISVSQSPHGPPPPCRPSRTRRASSGSSSRGSRPPRTRPWRSMSRRAHRGACLATRLPWLHQRGQPLSGLHTEPETLPPDSPQALVYTNRLDENALMRTLRRGAEAMRGGGSFAGSSSAFTPAVAGAGASVPFAAAAVAGEPMGSANRPLYMQMLEPTFKVRCRCFVCLVCTSIPTHPHGEHNRRSCGARSGRWALRLWCSLQWVPSWTTSRGRCGACWAARGSRSRRLSPPCGSLTSRAWMRPRGSWRRWWPTSR